MIYTSKQRLLYLKNKYSVAEKKYLHVSLKQCLPPVPKIRFYCAANEKIPPFNLLAYSNKKSKSGIPPVA